jgi:hypothetical protein
MNKNLYGFERLVFQLRSGTTAEIFNYILTLPIFDYSKQNSWLIRPILFEIYLDDIIKICQSLLT